MNKKADKTPEISKQEKMRIAMERLQKELPGEGVCLLVFNTEKNGQARYITNTTDKVLTLILRSLASHLEPNNYPDFLQD